MTGKISTHLYMLYTWTLVDTWGWENISANQNM